MLDSSVVDFLESFEYEPVWFRKSMIDNAACTMCGAEVESVGPIFCECLAAKELWLALPVEQSAGSSKIVVRCS